MNALKKVETAKLTIRNAFKRTGSVSFAFPAYEWWRPAEGDDVAVFGLSGNPNDPSTPLESGWAICKTPMLSPLCISNFIAVAPLTTDECNMLRNALGVEIKDVAKEKIEVAIQQLITSAALKSRLPSWEKFDTCLEKTIKSIEFVIAVLASTGEGINNGVLSVEQTVAAHLALRLSDSNHRQKIPEVIKLSRAMREVCVRMLDEAKTSKSTRGAKRNIPFYLFCMAMINVGQIANAGLSLPSPSTKSNKKGQKSKTFCNSDRSEPSFLRFVCEVVNLVKTKSTEAFGKSALSDDEKRTALNILSGYTCKTDRTIADNLRAAKHQLSRQYD